MSYLVTTEVTKAQADFTDILDFETQIVAERHAAVGTLLADAEVAGDLLTTDTLFVEDGLDYKATITSEWLDQATYESNFNDAAAQEEITRVEAAGYEIVRSLP